MKVSVKELTEMNAKKGSEGSEKGKRMHIYKKRIIGRRREWTQIRKDKGRKENDHKWKRKCWEEKENLNKWIRKIVGRCQKRK